MALGARCGCLRPSRRIQARQESRAILFSRPSDRRAADPILIRHLPRDAGNGREGGEELSGEAGSTSISMKIRRFISVRNVHEVEQESIALNAKRSFTHGCSWPGFQTRIGLHSQCLIWSPSRRENRHGIQTNRRLLLCGHPYREFCSLRQSPTSSFPTVTQTMRC